MSVHLKALPPLKAASCESKEVLIAAHSAVSGKKSDFFAALLEGLLPAEASPEVKVQEMEMEMEKEKEKERLKELLQQCQGEPKTAALLGLPEADAPREKMAQLVAIPLQGEFNPLPEVNAAGKALPVEELPLEKEEMAAAQRRSVFFFSQPGGFKESAKESAVEPKIVAESLGDGDENAAADFTGSIKSSFPHAAEGEQSSVTTATKRLELLKQKASEQLFAESSTVVAEKYKPAKTSISMPEVSPAPDFREKVKEGKEGRLLFSAAAEDGQKDLAVNLMLAAESDPGKKAAPVFSWSQLTIGKQMPPDPLSEFQRITSKAAPRGETTGSDQESGSAAGQENRYPVSPGAGEGEPFIPGGGSKGAFDSKGVLYSPAPPAELEEYALKVMEQIAERLRYLNRAGQQELRLKLEPEFLGEVLIRVRRLKGVLSAEVITRHAAVKELLEGQLETLRQRFQQADIEMGRFDVLLKDEDQGQDFPYTQKQRADQLYPEAAGVQKGEAPKELRGFPPELWEEKGKVNYLV